MPLTAYVLLAQQPADLAELWGTDVPGDGYAPGVNDAQITLGQEVPVRAVLGGPVANAELAADGYISPLADRVMPVVAGHAATLELRADAEHSPQSQQRSLCEVLAALPPIEDAVVWFPHRHQVTTQVMLVGELIRVPERAYYWIHGSWTTPEQVTAVVTVRGLSVVGSADLQVVGEPEDLRRFIAETESFVQDALTVGRLPVAGDTAEFADTIYTCGPGLDVLTEEPLLQLVPVQESDETAKRTIRRHWLAPHSSQAGPLEGPYAQLAAAFESLQADGIVARMDFACCQNCGHDEIADERTLIDENAEYPYRERGYVFFHAQDSDGLAEGSDKLYLAFGAFAGGPLMSPWPSSEPEDEEERQAFIEIARSAETTVGHTVTQALSDHGLRVDWTGDLRERIAVYADWSSVAFPWLREDEGDIELPPADPRLFDNAWYLLLNEEPPSLGDVMQDIMPNWSAQLREEQAISGEVPYDDPDVMLKYTLLSKMEFPELTEDAQRSGLPGAVEAAESHQAVLCIAAEGTASLYDQVMYQAGLAAEIGNRPEVIGLWIPNQERFEVEVHQVGEMLGKYPYVAIHRTEAEIDSGDGHALYTRGLKRLGLKELAVEDPEDLATTDMRNMLLVVVDKIVQSGKVPQAGEEIRTHSRKINALLHDVEDPVTREPALNVEFIDRKRFLGVF